MKKAALITGAAFALLLIASMGAFAFGGYGQGGAIDESQRGAYHEQMESILESGAYADLEALRAETGMPMMPFVQDEESFVAMRERHEQMEALHGEGPHFGAYGPKDGSGMRSGSGMRAGSGMGGQGTGPHDGSGMGRGMGFGGDCPMLND